MPSCNVIGCGAKKRAYQINLTFHRLPRNEIRKRKWLNIIGTENIRDDTKEIFICSRHFEESDFNRTLEIVKLRDDALPSRLAMEREMGAKSAVKLRNRGTAYKCELCGRKLMTPDALVVHKRTAHNIITKRRERAKASPKPVKCVKILPKPEVIRSVAEKKQEERPTIVVTTPSKSECEDVEIVSEMKKNMVEFECPKCFKKFPTYFPALKHIQKYHCVNRSNIRVAPNHPSLIQPVRIELCLKCNLKVKSIQTHICEGPPAVGEEKKLFVCTACDEWFPNLKGFDSHVLSVHGDGVESMFFPTSIEFTRWKTEMEQQTNVSYALLDKYDSKRYYHCNFVKDTHDEVNTTYFCPSTIVIQEFSKGIQVHFYKQHYKHPFTDYKLSHKYKKYTITSFLKRSEDYNSLVHLKPDDDDLYMQFKALMEGIVVDAAKINIATLKIILGKALEITSILTNYDEEIDDNNMSVIRTNQSMTDLEITEALEEPLAKRKLVQSKEDNDPKRMKVDIRPAPKPDVSSPKIINSFSLANTGYIKQITQKDHTNGKESTHIDLADDTIDNEVCKDIPKETGKDKKSGKDTDKKKIEMTKIKGAKDVNGDDTPSSFNDSYKDFVVKNFPHMETITTRSRARPLKPNLAELTIKTYEKPKKVEPLNEKPKRVEPPKLVPVSKPEEKPKVLDTQTEAQKPKPTNKSLEKKVIETPKAQAITETNQARVSFDKPKVDYEYEVKEQADDCNILILKIL